ncbi:hypothetical protein CTA2_12847 [Colletotrichum tanaceti]|uniref:Siderophore biosynthesis enzyme n=1 Tax=Colletotrichum tanaceti TaxID=1306861 RepID=A0A4U6XJG9_9PEZI|nr:hypothetical protein CTA2_12847 [Colletotrichum tanaceti]TKW54267.1 hypothetical protein CTA1_6444 [Colletotrichum tanaceti]
MSFRIVSSLAILATAVLAKTDLAGCVSSDSIVTPTQGGTPYATRVWYLPDTGEICAALDCGGGRAPPKTTVPGCASYEGTDTYSPSFLPLKTTAAATDGVAQTILPTIVTSVPETATTAITSATGNAASSTGESAFATGTMPAETDNVESLTGSDIATSSASEATATTAVVLPDAGRNATATFFVSTTSGARRQTSILGGGSAATAVTSATNTPNAAPTGASRELFGLVAGVAIGAILL